jgi:hypothetical protein
MVYSRIICKYLKFKKYIHFKKEHQRNDLHQKIFKHAERQSLNLKNTCEDKDALNLRVLLPLEETSSEMKVTNILKTLNNNI